VFSPLVVRRINGHFEIVAGDAQFEILGACRFISKPLAKSL